MLFRSGVELNDIVEGVANLEAVPGRFERVVEDLPYDVIVDYAHTPDGLEKLLHAARAITKNRVLLVFGACGDRDKGKRPIMGEIAAKRADRIFLTDEESYNEDPDTIRRMIYDGIEKVKGGNKYIALNIKMKDKDMKYGYDKNGTMFRQDRYIKVGEKVVKQMKILQGDVSGKVLLKGGGNNYIME